MAKKGDKKPARSKKTLELSLPDDLYDKAKDLAAKDPETLRSILRSILGSDANFGIEDVSITRQGSKDDDRGDLGIRKGCY